MATMMLVNITDKALFNPQQNPLNFLLNEHLNLRDNEAILSENEFEDDPHYYEFLVTLQITEELIESKAQEIFTLLKESGFIYEEVDSYGECKKFIFSLPSSLPDLSWWNIIPNWISKQMAKRFSFDRSMSFKDENLYDAFCEYAKILIKKGYIDFKLHGLYRDHLVHTRQVLTKFKPQSSTEVLSKLTLAPNLNNKSAKEPVAVIQARYFAKFLGNQVGLPLHLKPSLESFSHSPKHFFIEGAEDLLSKEQKLEIINWCMKNRPDWIRRWWRDDAWESNIKVILLIWTKTANFVFILTIF